ncbi:RNA-binding domain-containing protein [Acetobacterium wieringae]|uniref:RNA-binding domain-containing protein n=1 Tax=Acetobacterium wieringae TaxID=52694 RepID=UPI0026E98023|nr:RNA-binding domain-containing protein [Acetobacterium wieringae]
MNALILPGENKYVEFKADYTKTLLKTVSAFANYHDGIILIGIDDNRQLVGVKNADQMRLNLENTINDAIDPRPYYEIAVETHEGKDVILIRVYKGENTPYLYDKKAYKRLDTSSVPVDRSAFEELILYGKNLTFEMMKSQDQDLSFSVLNRQLKKRLNLRNITEDLLITLELKVKDQYNNAAALLSDNNPIKYSTLQLIAYNGTGVSEIKDRQTLTNQSILQHFDEGIDFYHKHINQSEIIEGAYRETRAAVPLVAYREALANLIVHRDYSKNTESRIEIFADRIEIISPGGLPIGINEEEYLSGRISVPRNRIIADIFLRLHIIEKLATGIRRIKEYYQNYPVEPVFRIYENSISVMLPNVDKKSQGDLLKNKYMDQLTLNEQKIVQLLKKNDIMTRREIEQELDLRKSQTNEILNQLKAYHLLIQVGSGRSTAYKLRAFN